MKRYEIQSIVILCIVSILSLSSCTAYAPNRNSGRNYPKAEDPTRPAPSGWSTWEYSGPGPQNPPITKPNIIPQDGGIGR